MLGQNWKFFANNVSSGDSCLLRTAADSRVEAGDGGVGDGDDDRLSLMLAAAAASAAAAVAAFTLSLLLFVVADSGVCGRSAGDSQDIRPRDVDGGGGGGDDDDDEDDGLPVFYMNGRELIAV